ncbi:hypothetical protein F5Y18DRAFT_424366 [Xylariaceae sp. FL1019]|nr:hypothetical protein F5Y18DRAFT_424366 [Xylariaceae sp. FL1019]
MTRPTAPDTTSTSHIPAWVNPDLHRLMVVNTKPGQSQAYQAWAQSLIALPAGAIFARINKVTAAESPTYTSIQTNLNQHVELNSDLKYINHSCDPTLELDTETMEFKVARHRPLQRGDVLSFFYPSSEWRMAQPFECWCGAADEKCLGLIEGAEMMDPERLRAYHPNPHVVRQLGDKYDKNESVVR